MSICSWSRGYLALLVASYFLYGRIVENLFGADEKLVTPAIRMHDGVDYVPMPVWKLFLIQFLYIAGFVLTRVDFQIIWRYFAWSNQTIAMLVLWTASVYLVKYRKFHWIASIPATFMTAVTTTYLFIAPEGFGLSASIAYPVGIFLAISAFSLFYSMKSKQLG